MESYTTYLRRFGLKLWAANFLGSLVTIIGLAITYFIFGLIVAATIFAELVAQFDQLLAPGANLAAITAFTETLMSYIIPAIISFFVLLLITLFFTTFNQAGAVASSIEAIRDQRVKIGTYFAQGLRQFFRIFLLSLVFVLIYFPVITVCILINTFLMNLFADPTMILFIAMIGALLIFVVMLIVGLFLMFAPTILIAENVGVFKAIALSVRLARRSFGKVFMTGLQLFLMGLAIGILFLLINLPSLIAVVDPLFIGPTISFLIGVLDFILMPVLLPAITVLMSLLITYRYYKYFREQLFPHDSFASEMEHSYRPTFSFTEDDDQEVDSGFDFDD